MSNDTVIASLKEKIDDLNQQAWEARVSDSPTSFQLSRESVELARGINYSKGLAEGLRSLGFGYIRLFKNEEAAPLLRESLSLFQSLNDLTGQAIVYEYLGIIERNWGNLGGSLELLLKGHALIKQAGPTEIEITSCYQIGVTYKHLGNHENALDYLYQALSLAKKTDFKLMEGYAINIIGSIYFDNGDYSRALDCYHQGLAIRQESHDQWGEAGSLDNIGFTYLKLNDLEKASDYCKQSLAISQHTADKKGEANALLHLAEIYQQAGDVKLASKSSNESLEIRKARGDRRGETEVLLFLADLHKNHGDIEDHQIFEWLSGALKTAEEIKAQDLLSKAYYNLHEFYTRKGNFRDSLIQLEAHLRIEKELHKNTINQKVLNLEITHKAEAISQRNKELTELNEQIEKANDELKIEASLERVRTTAMAMKEPADMLHVCRTISDQLLQLGFKEIRNVQTVIIYPQRHEYLNYQYFTPYDKDSIETIDYRLHPDVLEFTNQMLSSPDAYYTKTFEGEELHTWREYRKQTNQLPDPKLDATTSSHYYFYSIGAGALGVTTYAPLSEKEIGLFKRFRNVFELAYRRFVDIEKAEAQAREAQIQLALERVRARTMAMQRSDELPQAANLLFQQIQSLGFHAFSTGYNIWGEDKKTVTSWMSSGGIIQPSFKLPLTEETSFIECYEAALRGDTLFVQELGGAKLGSHLNYMRTLPVVGELMKMIAEAGFPLPDYMINHHAFFSRGYLLFITYAPVPEAHEIFKRFAKVFEQTYTRFLDLQKAEAQAKEAQIEAAVEKVRSRSLAMHKSDELQEVVHTVFERLKELNVDFYTAIIILFTEGSKDIIWWLESKANQQYPRMLIPFTPIPYFNDLFETKERGGDLFSQCYSFDEKNELFYHLFEKTEFKYVPEKQKQFLLGAEFATMSVGLAKNTGIQITSYSKKSFSDQDNQIIKRFANVFDQAYTRFLDLKKAEAQTKEAQTEVALERIRARAMAMHSSNELMDVAHILREQMGFLDQRDLETSVVNLFDEDSEYIQSWHAFREPGSSSGSIINGTVSFRKDSSELTREMIGHYNSGKKEYTLEATGEKLNEFIQVLINSQPEISNYIGKNPPEKVYYHFATFNGGALLTVSYQPTTEDVKLLQRRAAFVFEMAYRRYLDLKKAEIQAREAQIEGALERVRAKVMAMTNSSDLNETSLVFGEQLRKLGIDWQFSYFWLVEEAKNENTFWITWPDNKTSFTTYTLAEAEEYFNDCLVSWRAGVKIHDNYVAPEGVKEWLDTFQRIADDAGGEAKRVMVPQTFANGVYYYDAMMKYGSFGVCISKPATDEEKNIQCRFAIEFERAYTRFLDLQKAEAQARESQIELGLERVRARAMAMQKSGELKELIATVSTELSKLDIILDRCFIMTYDIKTLGVTWWMANPETSSDPIGMYVKYHEQPPYLAFLKAWQDRIVKWQYILEGSVKKTWDEFLFVETELSRLPSFVIDNMRAKEKVYLSASFNNFGCLTLATLEPLSDEQFDIMLRFAKVFDLTYTRFNDLKQAEAQARAAKIEAALERVRARALAMQEPEELKDVASVLRTEMGLLGVEELETCSIYINDADAEKAECWYALKDVRAEEKKLVNDHFALNLNDTWVGREMLQFYNADAKQISIIMTGDNRKEWIRYCEQRSVHLRGYYGDVIPDRTYHLYKFSHGAIGVATPGDISAESWDLLKRAASVFSLAYSRFKDLTQARTDLIKLKEEKKRAEDALTELQVTQKQLIQSEKMASLGELTAGIAHEIQNPLNFVNNFSDVSNELLEEMKTELATGNTEHAIEIVNDVKENLEKILHHGKRADAIVKGMLQHSRSSSGQKELTDINTLAEEYLRLAYHGLRAKDKFFNAKFETDLDPSIDKINVVPQDIGRVILNLINNSFYAVSEKKRSNGNGFEPSVTVSTKKLNDKVEIKVKDNGNGIPQKVLDKIFQPFFTTKPTGEGTGLGLSLSYDIITKGHDGEIKVETKEGEGSSFIISLPAK